MLTSPQDGTHPRALTTTGRASQSPPPPPHTARASQTHPGSLSLTQALGVSHHSHSSRPPTWTPTATASHTLVCAHTRITVTVTHNRLPHTHSIKTVLVSHMDTSTHSEHSPFHTDNRAPPETQSPTPTPRHPQPSHPYTRQWEIDTHSMLGPRVAWPVPGGRQDKAQGGLKQEGKVPENRGNRLFPTRLLPLLTLLLPVFGNEGRSWPEQRGEGAPR